METQYLILALILFFIGLFFYVMYIGTILANRKGAHISGVPFMAGIFFCMALLAYPKTRQYWFIGLLLDISFVGNLYFFIRDMWRFKKDNLFRITVLSENTEHGECCGEHGLSLYIEYYGHKILLDAGSSSLFYENAKKLGIDLSVVDYAVLSHSHYDHSNGFDKFFEVNGKAKLYARTESGECYYSKHDKEIVYIGPKKGMLEQYKNRIVYNDRDCCPIGFFSMVLIPHSMKELSQIGEKAQLYKMENDKYVPDDFSHEQTLILYSPKGLVVFNSCSHGGVTNIIKEVKEYDKDKNIYAYIGGFHLLKATDEDILELAKALKNTEIQRIITGHCTGDKAFEILKNKLGDRLEKMYSGMVFEI